MNLNFKDPVIMKNLLKGQFGIEKENIRINKEGKLSQIEHPFKNPQIDRDFSESQVEFITHKHDSIKEVLDELVDLQKQSAEKLLNLPSGEEYLWPFSNPPKINCEDEILIANFQDDLIEKTRYRHYLAKKYGKKKMLYSGIHFNFSLSDELIHYLYNTKKSYSSIDKGFIRFKNNIYLELAKKVTHYSWLIVYLTSASSVYDETLFDKEIVKKYASYRCSEYGYWNFFNPVLDYSSFKKYFNSINNYIKNGLICSAAELYYPVRLKFPDEGCLYSLCNSGVDHIELRMIDLNPLYEEGIGFNDVRFLHYFLVYLFSLPDIKFDDYEQVTALENEKKASQLLEENITLNFNNENVNIIDAGLKVLNDMEAFYKSLGYEDIVENINYQKEKFLNPKKRYAYEVLNLFNENYMEKGIFLAKEHALFSANIS